MANPDRFSVDTASLDGLRGVAAVWVMLFHCFIYCTFPIDLQGSSIMPLFFLLSGFSLMLAYGNRFDSNNEESLSTNASHSIYFERWNFYRNRLARVYPCYFVCSILAAPLWWAGYYGDATLPTLLKSGITSLLLASTAACFLFGVPLDPPGWTVCTLFVFWLIFPHSAYAVRRSSTGRLLWQIVACYWIQLGLIFVVFIPLYLLAG